MPITRRSFLTAGVVAPAVSALGLKTLRAAADPVPIRRVTQGPRFHWRGYYDKLLFDPSQRYLLANEVDFEHRSPRPEDILRVGMIDLHDKDRWIELGETRAWCWQQGCMLQWRPGSDREVVWNDREHDRFVCHLLDVRSGRKRTLPAPIYALSPSGTWGISTNFSRLATLRPGYGYNGIADPDRDQAASEETGVFRVDLETGEERLLVSLAQAARSLAPGEAPREAIHWFNHLLVCPDGSRFVFLHRWRVGTGPFRTRMLSAAADGSDLRVLIGSGAVSHFDWRDPTHVLAYAKAKTDGPWGFFVFEDRPEGAIEPVGRGVMSDRDGHCTFLAGARWILNDTYPDSESRQHLYLFDTRTQQRVDLGRFLVPSAYRNNPPHNEWRIDLHPGASRDGRLVAFDSPHEGNGRQVYLADVSTLIDTA